MADTPPFYRIFGPAERLRRLAVRANEGQPVELAEIQKEIELLVDGTDKVRESSTSARILDQAAEVRHA